VALVPVTGRALASLLTALLVATLGAPAPAAGAGCALSVAGLRTDDLPEPLGIDNRTPVLSWKTTATAPNARQSAVEVQAAGSREGLLAGRADLWSTGRRALDTPWLAWGGVPLTSRARVFWRVRAFDAAGLASPWSAPAGFELGLLEAGDWTAGWITEPAWTQQRYNAVVSHPVTVRFPALETRHVRLSVTELGATPTGDAGHYVQLAEMEAYGDAEKDRNLAAGGTVTASSTLSCCGWQIDRLTDGVRVGRPGGALGWTTYPSRAATDTAAAPAWVSVDLGTVRTVDRVVLYPRTDVLSTSGGTAGFPVDFAVQAGGPDTWATVATVADQPAPAAPTVQTPAALPVLAGEFDADGFDAGDPGVHARLYVAGVGVVVASVNGRPVGDAVLEPGYTDLRKRVGYATYDVTGLIRPGGNAIGVRLGTGIASVGTQPGRYTKFTATQSLPKVVAQLELTDAAGRRRTVGTDAGWRATQGPTTVSHWFGGESYDARRELPGWDQPGTDRDGWQAAAPTTPVAAGTVPAARSTPPLRVVDERAATEIGAPADGVRVFDVGTNIAGWVRLRIDAPVGHRVTIHPAELMTRGRVDQSSTGSPIVDEVISDGTPRTWHPEFMYHGFRYVEVRGVTAGVTVSELTGLVIRADNDHVGELSTSDPVVDGVHRIIDRAVQSNMYSVLTDCPHREKLGWLEQTHLVFGTIMRNYDVAAYARGIVRSIAEAQLPNGLVPDIAPEYAVFSGGFRDDPNWGSAMILLPWEMYRNYGDVQTLRRYYPNMRAYVSYLDTRATGDLLRYGSSGLGDWGELLTGSARTDVDLVVNAGYHRAVDSLARIAGALGEDADAAAYRAKAAAVRAAFQARWYDPVTHDVANGSQASLVLALDIGAIPADDRPAVVGRLTAAVEAAGRHLNVGEIALPAAFRVLSAAGRDDLVHAVATQTTSPGYGYFVTRGATSLPEYWDMTSSQNHFMLGSIDEWFSARLVGLRQADDSVAYRDLVVQPSVVGGMTHAQAAYRTPYGRVAVGWQLTGDTLRLEATVPVGSTATVYVPSAADVAPPATPPGTTAAGLRRLADGRDYATFTVGSGTWTFTAAQPTA
jgi:alpha-L-rhamnosidase